MSVGPAIAEREPSMVGTSQDSGRPVTQVGQKRERLRRLVSLGFLSDSQQPDKSETGRRLTPGPLNYDHFEVEVGADGFPIELGAGAMAITYRARDTVLNSTVALKVIDRRVAQNPGARSRFLREARVAAQIRHPNVARVTHYGEQDGECFYVMELVEGETLETRVRRDGPMPLALALKVIQQAARALAAAEACGVVHRDIKPSNIMLESDAAGALVVKVIDYGIAKVVAAEPRSGAEQTQSGFIGTPAFASPEQFAPPGEMRIDTRSDVYSLGVTFWYLLSSRVPFVGRTLEEVHARQTEHLPVEQLKSLHVPTRVISLLKLMLAPDLKDRPQSARELLSAVYRCYAKYSAEARARRRRAALAATGTALVIAGIASGAWLYQHAHASAEMERSIAVLPFENLTPNGEDTYFTEGMQIEITNDLARLAGVRVIGARSTRSYVPDRQRDLRVIGRDLGVRYLLEGTVSRDNDLIRVALKLVDLRNSAHPWTGAYQRTIKDVFALQSEITHVVASRLQARLSPNETVALESPPTGDLRAYDFYLRALAIDRLVKDTAEQASVTQQKISLLDEAVKLDPNFVLAYCELAKAHDTLYDSRHVTPVEDRDVDHRALAEAALEKARRLEPDSGPIHLALADYFLRANNDVEQARAEIDLARRTLPNSAELEMTAGMIARRQSRWSDAVRSYERAVTLEPKTTANLFTLANTYRLMRRYDDFDRLMAKLLEILPPQRSATYRVFRAFGPLEGRGELAPLRRAVSTVTPEEDPDGAIRDLHDLILAIWDNDPASVSKISARATESTLVFNGVKYPKSWYEALAARMRGDNANARSAFTAARLEAEKAAMTDANDGRTLSLLAMIDAGLGRKQLAVEEALHACDLVPFKSLAPSAPFVRCNLAIVYAWNGQVDLAISTLDSLVNRPAGTNLPAQPTYGDFRLNPVWDPLRNDPRFTAIMKRLAPVASSE
jgi:TolB-like protein/Flp pilus assembly protein TadD